MLDFFSILCCKCWFLSETGAADKTAAKSAAKSATEPGTDTTQKKSSDVKISEKSAKKSDVDRGSSAVDASGSSAAGGGRSTTDNAELDVESMLKDFSDQLKENLLPDPWD